MRLEVAVYAIADAVVAYPDAPFSVREIGDVVQATHSILRASWVRYRVWVLLEACQSVIQVPARGGIRGAVDGDELALCPPCEGDVIGQVPS